MKTSRRLLTSLLTLVLAAPTPPVLANPVGETLVAGHAAFDRSRPGQLIINQGSHRAIINWADFSIGRGEVTSFVMPSSSASVLNRVVGINPSQLFGTLRGNGNVYVINPNGIFVGRGGVVNTHSLTASTLDVSDSAYLAGAGLRFSGGSTAGVKNDGSIRALGGDVFLIGRTVENAGTIQAPQGKVGLAAGSEVILQPAGTERLSVVAGNSRAPKGDKGVNNVGTIEAVSAELKAAGGNIYSLAINNGGVIRATGVRHENGRVVLFAEGGDVENSGSISAQNANGSGGSIALSAGHNADAPATLIQSGKITARGEAAGTEGGDVRLLGDQVGVGGQALVDVSGRAGGGTALIGGDTHGGNPEVQNAARTFVGADAQIRADALDRGDGGKVVVWADDVTRFYGSISARGGDNGGQGGFAEVSGRQSLLYAGTADMRAPHGLVGRLLLDPKNITVSDTGDPFVAGDYDFSDNDSSSVTILNTGANSLVSALDLADVTLQANNDIQINAPVDATGNANDHNLTLEAGRGIAIDANVTLRGSFTAVANHSSAVLAQRDTGTASFTMGSGVTIDTSVNGPHDISISYDNGVVGAPANQSGLGDMVIRGLNSGGGTITLNSANAAAFDRLLDVQGAVASGGGNINLTAGSLNLAGTLNSGSGLITLTATGGRSIGLGAGAGDLTLSGPGLAAITTSGGLRLVTTGSGDITVDGVAGTDSANITGPLALDAGGAVNFSGAASTFNSLTVDAGTAINLGANVTTSGSQTYNDLISLVTDITLDGAALTLSQVTGNSHDLTLNGSSMTTLAGQVSGVKNFTTGAGGVTTISGGGVNTTGDQTYNNSLDLASDTVLQGANLTLNSVNGNSHDLELDFTGDTLIDGLNFSGVKNLTTGGGGLTLLTGGTITTSGSQTYNDSVELQTGMALLGTDLTLASVDGSGFSLTLSGSGVTTLGGAVSAVADFKSDGGGSTAINGGAITTTGMQQYDDEVRLGADTTLTGSGVVFNGALDSAAGTLHGLVVNASGLTAFQGPVGASDRLSALTTDAAGLTVLAGSLQLNGSTATFNDQVLLTADATIDQAGPGDVTFNNTVDSVSGHNFALTVNTPGGGNTLFNGAVGANSLGVFSDSLGLGAVTTDAAGLTLINGVFVVTTGNQTYHDAVTLGADTTLTGTDVSFEGALDSAAGTLHSLTVNASGVTRFSGAVGGTDRLATVTTDAAGRTEIASSIQLNGSSTTFNDAVLLTGNATLDEAGAGDLVFNGPVESATGNNYSLTVNTPGSGATIFNGAVGHDALGALSDDDGLGALTTDGPGLTQLNGGNVRTTGSQTYNDAVTLGADATLSGIDVSFLGALDSAAGTLHSLTVNANGATRFNGVVGGSDRLSALTTDAAGRTELGGASVNVNGVGGVNFNDRVLLTADAIINQAGVGSVTFNNTLDSAVGNDFTLAVNTPGGASTVFNGAVGSDAFAAQSNDNGLGALTTDAAGGIAINGGVIRTSGSQTYNDPVTLGANATLTSVSAGNVTFNHTLNSAAGQLRSLTVNAAGVTAFNAQVGAIDRLFSLTTDQPGRTDINAGTINLNGATATTFNDAVLLNASLTINQAGSGDVVFGGNLDSRSGVSFALTVNTSGGANTVFNGSVGGVNGLGSLTTDGLGLTLLNGALVRTVGNQNYADEVTLGADVAIEAATVTLHKVNGAGQALTLTADNIALTPGQAINVGRLTLQPRTPGRDIDLGTETSGRLSLTQLELNNVTASVLQIGSLSGGILFVTAPISLGVQVPTLRLAGGLGINQSAAAPLTVNNLAFESAGDVLLAAANHVGTVAGSLTMNDRSLSLCNAIDLTVGTVDGIVGITAGDGTPTAGGNIMLAADNLTIAQQINAGSGKVVLQSKTAGRAIDLGTETSGKLSLTAAELAHVRAGTLKIGDSAAGAITISDGLDFGVHDSSPSVGTLSLESAKGISETAAGWVQVKKLGLRSSSPSGAVLDNPMNDWLRLGASLSGPLVVSDIGGFTSASSPPDDIDGLTSVSVSSFDSKDAALNAIAAVTYRDLPMTRLTSLALEFSPTAAKPPGFDDPHVLWTSYLQVPPAPEDPARKIRKVEDQPNWTTLPVSASAAGARWPW